MPSCTFRSSRIARLHTLAHRAPVGARLGPCMASMLLMSLSAWYPHSRPSPQASTAFPIAPHCCDVRRLFSPSVLEVEVWSIQGGLVYAMQIDAEPPPLALVGGGPPVDRTAAVADSGSRYLQVLAQLHSPSQFWSRNLLVICGDGLPGGRRLRRLSCE